MFFLTTGEGGEEKMRKEMKITAFFLFAILLSIPLSSAMITPSYNASRIKSNSEPLVETTQILCKIGNERITTEISIDALNKIANLVKEKKQSFLIIYNKYSTLEEVEQAFTDIQPVFKSLVLNGLTTKTVNELNDLFYKIRDMIKKPRHNPFSDPQTLGGWNGLPTLLVFNMACGIYTIDTAIGITIGTNTVLPTAGADLTTIWLGIGETMSVGWTGVTTSTGPELGIIIGFLGILLATPFVIAGFLIQLGIAGVYAGFGPAPF
jgi:hypothetical protein